jgi:hypothetical protein
MWGQMLSAVGDTESLLVEEMTALVRRAIALGRKLGKEDAVHRILRAVDVDGPIDANDQGSLNTPVGNGMAPVVASGAEESIVPPVTAPAVAKRPEYGVVKNAIRRALLRKEDTGGLGRNEVPHYCLTTFEVEITPVQARNTLKILVRDREAIRRDGRYFPGPHLVRPGEPGPDTPRLIDLEPSEEADDPARKVGGT